jgi:hypothetical protein
VGEPVAAIYKFFNCEFQRPCHRSAIVVATRRVCFRTWIVPTAGPRATGPKGPIS